MSPARRRRLGRRRVLVDLSPLELAICEIVESLRLRHEWSEGETAKALGLSQSTVNRMMHKDQRLKLSTLETACRNLGLTPVEFLQLHPRYNPRAGVRDLGGGWQQFLARAKRVYVTPEEALRVISISEEARELGIQELLQESVLKSLETARAAHRKALRFKPRN
jgi:transcriptional regulator with XRE-family HTH domain